LGSGSRRDWRHDQLCTKDPHTGRIVIDAFTSYDSLNGYRAGYGSGGTSIKDLDYRFDISHLNDRSFIDDTFSKLSSVSGQLNYRVTGNLKVWGAAEYRQDKDRFYWGTPPVPANAPDIVPTTGVVSELWTNYYLNGHLGSLNPAAIDAHTTRTTYNVLDNHSGANELWLRSGFQWEAASLAMAQPTLLSGKIVGNGKSGGLSPAILGGGDFGMPCAPGVCKALTSLARPAPIQ
jgi:hypothetical protein